MVSQTIYSSNLKDYKPILWQGKPIFQMYAKIKNYLKLKLGEEYAHLLAEPFITVAELRGSGEAYWSSQAISKQAIPLEQVNPQEQGLVRQRLNEVQAFIQELSNSTDRADKQWAELLQKAFVIPSEQCILADNGQFALVLWSFESVSAQQGKYGISDIFHKPTTDTVSHLPTTASPTKDDTEHTQQEEKPQETPQEDKTEIKQYNQEDEESKETSGYDKYKEPSESFTQEETTETEPPKNKLKKYIWILLLILAALIAVYFLKQCSSTVSYLPDRPNEIIPIDTNKIIKDPTGAKMIVGDRLNIALIGKNQNIEQFAEAFKKAYPSKDYQIIYYDTLIYRVQILVPEEKRQQLKTELKESLPDFEMLIFEENIMDYQKIPDDPDFQGDIKKYWYHNKIKALDAWDITQGDTSLIVAIIDDGFDLSHPELKGKIYKPFNIPKRSSKITNNSKHGLHGTHVAGIALGLMNNTGVAGIAPNCKLMPIQVGDENGIMSQTAVIDAILYAIYNGASVMNLSLGMMVPPGTEQLTEAEQERLAQSFFKEEEEFYNSLFKVAYDKNIVTVLAAGNQDVIIGLDPMQRSNYTIKVSAIDPNDKKAKFSNYGAKSTISAPGVQIYSSIPKQKFDYLDGTSMASPIIAGGVALIRSVNPALSFDQIVDLMQATGIPTNTTSSKKMGNILQLDKALEVARRKRQNDPQVDCPNAQTKIDSLLQAIERIKRECMDGAESPRDTLKIPDKQKDDFAFAAGRWKSTTYLYNEQSEKVTIYFDFYKNGKGQITLIEDSNNQLRCEADLALSLKANLFGINQLTDADCINMDKQYNPYTFECKPDKNGYAECTAQNKINKKNNFVFQLVKIK
jgi:flagellar motor protein MotB